MSNEDVEKLRKAIIDYVKERAENGSFASVRDITRRFKISNEKFYQLFPKGIEQVHSEAGHEIPKERIEATQYASEARRKNDVALGSIPLPPEMSQDINAIDFLEDGKGPIAVVAGLIEQYRAFRDGGVTLGNWKNTVLNANRWLKVSERLESYQKNDEPRMETFARLTLERDEFADRTTKAEEEKGTITAQRDSEIRALQDEMQSRISTLENQKQALEASRDREIETSKVQIQSNNSQLEREKAENVRLNANLTKRNNQKSAYNRARSVYGDELDPLIKEVMECKNLGEQKKQLQTEITELEQTAHSREEKIGLLVRAHNTLGEKGSKVFIYEVSKDPVLAKMFIQYASPEELQSMIDKVKLTPLERQNLLFDLKIQNINEGFVARNR